MADRTLLVVDFSNLVHVAWWPAQAAFETDPKYDPRKVVLTNVDGKLRRIRETLAKAGVVDPEVVFVEDRRPARKIAAFPGYRASREHKMPPDVYPLIKQHLQAAGFRRWCWSEDNEADDTIASLVHQSRDRAAVVASTDKDLWQLIDAVVWVYNTTKDRFVTLDDVHEKFGVTQFNKIPLVKALWGDSGDDVPNAVPRMQKYLLPLIEASDGTLEDFFRLYDTSYTANVLSSRCRDLVDAARFHQIVTNWSLVKLDTTCTLTFEEAA